MYLGWFAACWLTQTELTSTEFNNAPLTNGWTMLNSLRPIRWLTLQRRQGCSLTRNGADRASTHDCSNTLGFTVCMCAHTVYACAALLNVAPAMQSYLNQPAARTYLGNPTETLTAEWKSTDHRKYSKTGILLKPHGEKAFEKLFFFNLSYVSLKTILDSVMLHHPCTRQTRKTSIKSLQLDTVRGAGG